MARGLPDELVEALVDPETRAPLRRASVRELTALREALARGAARRRDGELPPTDLEGAFLTEDGRVAYPIVDGVPNFLIEERLELDSPVEVS